MKEFTNDEKVIAKNIDKKYKWMARDSYGNIYVHQKKPTKLDDCWNTAFTRSGELFAFNHMFKSIKWEDDEPTLIKDIYDPQILDTLEKVNRRHWIDNYNGTISCSGCQTWFYKYDRYSYMDYCPYCGAKMEGKKATNPTYMTFQQ